MGQKHTKDVNNNETSNVSFKRSKRRFSLRRMVSKPYENIYETLSESTGVKVEVIRQLHTQFQEYAKPDVELSEEKFVKFYATLRTEDPERIKKISKFIFRCFDADKSHFLSFDEFIYAYGLTVHGDIKDRLELAFKMYDTDNNGTLDRDEIKQIIKCMLDLLDVEETETTVTGLVNDCMNNLDKDNNGVITKDEFINGLLKNFKLRPIMMPFC